MTVLPPLKALHPDSSLSQTKLEDFERLSTDAILKTLQPGQPHCLKARVDGTMLDGHHRIYALRMRHVDVDALPRDVHPSD